ncbi:hypothetical protein, partial [Pseudomonas protegens]|uniref:hypothetical protein n=1 Tax=Pseudomonas protegens TaxID=380021 RepID=UPI001CA5C52A
PVAGTKAISEGDKTLIQQRDLNTWNGKEPIPRSWQSAAAIAAEASQPLGRVVETLFQLANQ